MNLSTVSRRLVILSVLVLFLLVVLAPVGVVTAGPAGLPEPIPVVPPDEDGSGGAGTGGSLALLNLVVSVGTAVVL
ncbi:MAG: hypothetical protein NTX17_04420 [Candidatus Eisenbacteria bacterium]|nr:hypothetical protein [Candidatus Eisenbacteria bacterium]